jgi:hypothetical protein
LLAENHECLKTCFAEGRLFGFFSLKNQISAFQAKICQEKINLGKVALHVIHKNFLIIITAKQVAACYQIEKNCADTKYVTFLIIPSFLKNFRCDIAGRPTLFEN